MVDIKQRLADFEDEANGETETESNLTKEEKNELRNGVNEYIAQIKTSTNGDTEEYARLLEEQIKAIARSDAPEEEKEYRISLYKDELYKAKGVEDQKDKFEEETKDMSLEDMKEKLVSLESKRSRLENMPASYVENGKTRDELLAETDAMIYLYKQKIEEEEEEKKGKEDREEMIYYAPNRVSKANTGEENLDDMINDADDFVSSAQKGKDIGTLNQQNLQNFSKTMYNILLAVGVAAAVIVGALLGIKLMISSVEEKAEVKGLIVPYIAGCVIVFGGFTIWKIAVEILSKM